MIRKILFIVLLQLMNSTLFIQANIKNDIIDKDSLFGLEFKILPVYIDSKEEIKSLETRSNSFVLKALFGFLLDHFGKIFSNASSSAESNSEKNIIDIVGQVFNKIFSKLRDTISFRSSEERALSFLVEVYSSNLKHVAASPKLEINVDFFSLLELENIAGVFSEADFSMEEKKGILYDFLNYLIEVSRHEKYFNSEEMRNFFS